jgi:hypothetical protein
VESGHPMLIPAALDSAKQSRFECRLCSAPVSYLLVYSFKLTTPGDCCDAFSVPPQVEQEPQSIDPQERPQTQVSIAAEQICLCDPAVQLTKKRSRSLKCLHLWEMLLMPVPPSYARLGAKNKTSMLTRNLGREAYLRQEVKVPLDRWALRNSNALCGIPFREAKRGL